MAAPDTREAGKCSPCLGSHVPRENPKDGGYYLKKGREMGLGDEKQSLPHFMTASHEERNNLVSLVQMERWALPHQDHTKWRTSIMGG